MRLTAPIVLVVSSMVCCGCGGYTVVPVSGVVTLDNKPVPNAHVNFTPLATKENPTPGPGSYGKTDANGKFTLMIVAVDSTNQAGAVVGNHRVSISGRNAEEITAGGEDADAVFNVPEDPVPHWYNTNTILKFDVPSGGTDQANFKLSRTMPKP